MSEETIRVQLREELIRTDGTRMDMDKLIQKVEGSRPEVLRVLRELMSEGKIYLDYGDIDGRGKVYTNGLIEEEA